MVIGIFLPKEEKPCDPVGFYCKKFPWPENKDSLFERFTDSWCVADGLAIRSGKWKRTNWAINGKDIWSKEAWQELDEMSREVKIIVYRVGAHTGKQDETSENNEIMDKSATALFLKREWKAEPQGDKLKIDGIWKPLKPTTELDIPNSEILELRTSVGHIGTHGLYRWFTKRNIKVTWNKVNQAIRICEECPKAETRLRHNYKGNVGHKIGFNYIVQTDFIGPLSNFRNKYVCTVVDVTTGLGLGVESPNPNRYAAILAIWRRCSVFGTPIDIRSDRGTRFTGREVQRLAKNLNRIWNFHKAYTPTAAGAIERFNGLLKNNLRMHEKEKLAVALRISLYELNNSNRLNRNSPIEEVIKRGIEID